jgi:predicted DNA-binding transcriptional regulator AlpA
MHERETLTDNTLLTVADLAKMLQLSQRRVREMVLEGECPSPFKLGGAVRWRWGTIRKWVEAVEFLTAMRQGKTTETRKAAKSGEERRSAAAGKKATSGDSEPG